MIDLNTNTTKTAIGLMSCCTLADCSHETSHEAEKIKNAKRGDFKICGNCKNEFPKTEDYFFKRIIKQKNINGSIVEYKSFRSMCKKCHANKTLEYTHKKRCDDLKCNIEDYNEKWKHQYSETRTKFPDIKDIPYGKRGSVLEKLRTGYKYSTYEQYKIDCRASVSKVKRKYDYGDVDFVSIQERNRSSIKNLTDSYIALLLKKKVRDLPKEIIETKRLIIKLERELINNNIKIK